MSLKFVKRLHRAKQLAKEYPVMHRILSLSQERQGRHQHRLLLENSGYTVVPTATVAEANVLIDSGQIDAVLLGSAISLKDRMSVALLGVNRNIPVICMCGLRADGPCPVVHVQPSQPKELLAALESVFSIGNPAVRWGREKVV
jgi:hypothetical protein